MQALIAANSAFGNRSSYGTVQRKVRLQSAR